MIIITIMVIIIITTISTVIITLDGIRRPLFAVGSLLSQSLPLRWGCSKTTQQRETKCLVLA